MAFNVGSANIVVRVVTLQAQKELQGLQTRLKKLHPEAETARERFQSLTKTGYTLGPAIATIVSAISALIGTLGSLVGAAGAAGASVVVLGNVFSGFILALLSAKIAMGGVFQALNQVNKGSAATTKNTDAVRLAQQRLAQVIERNNEAIVNANKQIYESQVNLNDALAAGREELQQLGFAAEEAALAQQGAALDLERAREELARVQDLPPNSRIRREAELAFAQAELQYRQAVDANADLAAEQEKYADSGVEGTEQVINARRQLAEAEADLARAVRDGLRAQIDAERALTSARQQGASGGGGDPYANLTKSQAEFVKRVSVLRPLFRAVKEDVAAAFLPLVGDAVIRFARNTLPTIGAGLASIAGQFAVVIDRTTRFLASTEGLALLENFFSNTSRIIGPMADAMGQLAQAFLKIFNAAAPLAERFVGFLQKSFTDFNAYLDQVGQSGLTDFFNTAGDAAAEFGDLFGEIFRFIGQLIKVNLGEDSPGRDFVRWMTDGLKAANDLRDSNLFGTNGLSQYFEDVNNNTKQILSSLGALGRVFIDIGDNQSIGETFTILKDGAPALTSLLDKLNDAGPSLARLVNIIIGIADAFTDSIQINAFFDTLVGISQVFLDIVRSEPVQQFLATFGPLLAQILALNTVFKLATFGINVFFGGVIALATGLGTVAGAFRNLTGVVTMATAFIGRLGSALTLVFAANPYLLAAVAAITALSIGFIALNNHIESTAATTKDFANTINVTKDRLTLTGQLLQKETFWEIGFADPEVRKKFENGTKDILDDLKGFTSDAGRQSAAMAEWGQYLPFNDIAMQTVDANNAIKDYGKTLAELPLDEALAGFKLLTEGQNLNYQETNNLIGEMPQFRQQLIDIANELGIAATEGNLVGIAMGSIEYGAEGALGPLQSLTDQLDAVSGSFVDNERAQIRINDAFRQGKQFAREHAGAIAEGGARADAAKSQLLDMRDSIVSGAKAVKDTGGDVNAFWDKNREKLEKVAAQLFGNREEATAYIDEILGTPEEITTVLKQKIELNTSSAKQELQGFANYVTTQFKGKLPDSIASAVNQYIKANYSNSVAKQFGTDFFATGGMVSYAGEGIYSGRYAGIHKFAEPETGWEAYVSGRKGSEGKNRAILTEAASRLGMNVGGGGINITVNPSPGMDERALAGAVSQEITKLMRKGSMY